jgi:ABC-type multidrug transport system ATPase subunit
MNVIELKNISKSFKKRKVIDEVNLTIQRGEFVVLRGANGSGKTTLLNIILGLLKPDRGEVKLLGSSPQEPESKYRVGVVLQKVTAPKELKVKELVNLFRSYYPNPLSTEELLKKVNIEEKRNLWASKLSGGEGQRLYFALALAGNPDLLILDEPTRNLDTEGYSDFWEQIEACRKSGITVLMVTNNQSDWEKLNQLATRLITLKDGSLEEEAINSVIAEEGGATINLKKTEDYQRTILECNKAIELDPKDADAHNKRGLAYYNLEQYQKAQVDYNKAIELNPSFPDAYNNRGILRYKLGKYQEAMGDYSKAAELNSNSGGDRNKAAKPRWFSTLFSQTWVELIQLLRTPVYLAAVFLFPLLVLFLPDDIKPQELVLLFFAGINLLTFGIDRLGRRIAAERIEGWLKLLRVTPLPPAIYLTAKTIMSLLVLAVILSLVLFLGGKNMDLSEEFLTAEWPRIFLSLIIGMIPFVILGLALGYLFKPKAVDSIIGLSIPVILATCGLPLPVPKVYLDLLAFSPFYHYGQLALWSADLDYDSQLTIHVMWLLWAGCVFSSLAVWAYRRDRVLE